MLSIYVFLHIQVLISSLTGNSVKFGDEPIAVIGDKHRCFMPLSDKLKFQFDGKARSVG